MSNFKKVTASVLAVGTLLPFIYGGQASAANYQNGNFVGSSIVSKADGNVKAIANSRSNDGTKLDEMTVRAYLYVNSALSQSTGTYVTYDDDQIGIGTNTVRDGAGTYTARGYHTFKDAGYSASGWSSN